MSPETRLPDAVDVRPAAAEEAPVLANLLEFWDTRMVGRRWKAL